MSSALDSKADVKSSLGSRDKLSDQAVKKSRVCVSCENLKIITIELNLAGYDSTAFLFFFEWGGENKSPFQHPTSLADLVNSN